MMRKKTIITALLAVIPILAGILSAEWRFWLPVKDDRESKLAFMGGSVEPLTEGGIGFGLRSPLTLNGVNELCINEDGDYDFERFNLEAHVGQWNEFWWASEDCNNDSFPDTCRLTLGPHNNCIIALERDSSLNQTWEKAHFMLPSPGQSGPVFVYHDLNYDGVVDTRVKTDTERKPQCKWVLKENRWIHAISTIDQYTVEVEVDDASSRYLFFHDGKWQEDQNVSAYTPSPNISDGGHEHLNP